MKIYYGSKGAVELDKEEFDTVNIDKVIEILADLDEITIDTKNRQILIATLSEMLGINPKDGLMGWFLKWLQKNIRL